MRLLLCERALSCFASYSQVQLSHFLLQLRHVLFVSASLQCFPRLDLLACLGTTGLRPNP